MEIIYLSNSSRIRLSGLKTSDGIVVNSATVTVTVVDSAGAQVGGATWPIDMIYESGSDGNYSEVLPDSLNLELGKIYRAKVTATFAGLKLNKTQRIKVRKREDI